MASLLISTNGLFLLAPSDLPSRLLVSCLTGSFLDLNFGITALSVTFDSFFVIPGERLLIYMFTDKESETCRNDPSQHHIGIQWESQDLNPGGLIPEPIFSPIRPYQLFQKPVTLYSIANVFIFMFLYYLPFLECGKSD